MKRFLLVPIALAVLALAATSTAYASGKPTRAFAPLPQQFLVQGSCSYDVRVDVIRNNEYMTTFYDPAGNPIRALITGALVVSLTNVTNWKSIVVNISGPAYYTLNADGSVTLREEGNSATPLPGQLFLASGSVTLLFPADGGPPQVQSISGKTTDVCAMLA